MTWEEMPPVMKEMFRLLPPPGQEWPMEERLKWVRAFEAICRMLFKSDGGLEIN